MFNLILYYSNLYYLIQNLKHLFIVHCSIQTLEI
jgi:hypothetical protein